jgi:nucleoside-triphosphatase
LIKKLAARFPDVVGFYTEEIREKGVRKGFELIRIPDGSSRGAVAPLSHIDIKGPHRVGKYGVDVEGFDLFLDDSRFDTAGLIIIDEIGKMECLSEKFRRLIVRLLDGDRPLIATIAERGTPFIEGLKKIAGVRLIEVTEKNRGSLPDEIGELVRETS